LPTIFPPVIVYVDESSCPSPKFLLIREGDGLVASRLLVFSAFNIADGSVTDRKIFEVGLKIFVGLLQKDDANFVQKSSVKFFL